MANVGGRPTKFSVEICLKITERMIGGESLRAICRDDEMPTASTVLLWVAKGEMVDCPDADMQRFSVQYVKAMEARADALADEILDIADDGTNDWMEKHAPGNEGWQQNGETLARSRLRVDTRKWVASKLKAKRYGDKQQVEHSGGIEVDLKAMTDEEIEARLAALEGVKK